MLAALATILVQPVEAQGHSVVVVVAATDPDVNEDLENALAGDLHDRGVPVVDPSSIDVTYHEQARLAAERSLTGFSINYSAMAWITTRYHSDRAMLTRMRFSTRSAPYGEFTVYEVRAIASYRCYDVIGKRLVSAGSFTSTGRGEDYATVRDRTAGEEIGRAHV